MHRHRKKLKCVLEVLNNFSLLEWNRSRLVKFSWTRGNSSCYLILELTPGLMKRKSDCMLKTSTFTAASLYLVYQTIFQRNVVLLDTWKAFSRWCGSCGKKAHFMCFTRAVTFPACPGLRHFPYSHSILDIRDVKKRNEFKGRTVGIRAATSWYFRGWKITVIGVTPNK